VQTALIDLGSSLSVTTPSIAKLSGATLVSSFNLHPLMSSMMLLLIFCGIVQNLSRGLKQLFLWGCLCNV
jgi:hypothetical protein